MNSNWVTLFQFREELITCFIVFINFRDYGSQINLLAIARKEITFEMNVEIVFEKIVIAFR